MEQFLPLIYLVGWFGAIFVCSYLINWLLVRSIIRKWYRLFVAPGVVVHELSHAAGCLMTGSQITEINFWKASGGHVKHLASHDPLKRLISDPMIALAPIWGTFIILGLLTWLMMPELFEVLQSRDYSYLSEAINFTSWQSLVYLYLTTSLLATIAPSKTDMNYALGSLIVIGIIMILLSFLPGVSQRILVLEDMFAPYAIFSLLLLVIGVIVAFILALPYRKKRFVAKEQIA